MNLDFEFAQMIAEMEPEMIAEDRRSRIAEVEQDLAIAGMGSVDLSWLLDDDQPTVIQHPRCRCFIRC